MNKVIYTFIMNEEHRFEVKYAVPPHYRVQTLPNTYRGPAEATIAFREAVPDAHEYVVPVVFDQFVAKQELPLKDHERLQKKNADLQKLVRDYYDAALIGALEDPTPHDERDFDERMKALQERAEVLLNMEEATEQEEIDHEELARQAELRIQQTFASQFSILEEYEAWKEANNCH